jgi:cap1 methyltransferase
MTLASLSLPPSRPDVVRALHAAKAQFDPVPSQKFRDARRNANPWELIGKSVFINRAAVKMANMDALMHFRLTDPDNDVCCLPAPAPKPRRRVLIADAGRAARLRRRTPSCSRSATCAPARAGSLVCGAKKVPPAWKGKGRGGREWATVIEDRCGFVSEYVLWRREGIAEGWGMTLKDGDHDFMPWRFVHQPASMFHTHYGADGTGDVTNTANIRSFARVVDKGTRGRGVALFMADGGFSVEGEENYQVYLVAVNVTVVDGLVHKRSAWFGSMHGMSCAACAGGAAEAAGAVPVCHGARVPQARRVVCVQGL